MEVDVHVPEWNKHLYWEIARGQRTLSPSPDLWVWLEEFSHYTVDLKDENHGMTFKFNDPDVAELFKLTWT
jgi:hypothetical protein